MSVNYSFALPAQPDEGGFELVPLGGNGFTAPHSMYLASPFITGDASGGIAEVDMTLDDRYTCLVNHVQVDATSAAGAKHTRIVLFGPGSFAMSVAPIAPVSSIDTVARASWSPDPLFKARSLKSRWLNVDTEVYYCHSVIYNFDIRAAEEMPLSALLASLPRSESVIV